MRFHHFGIEVADLIPVMDYFTKELGYAVSASIPFPGYDAFLLAAGNRIIELTSPLSKEDKSWVPSSFQTKETSSKSLI